MCRSNIPGGWIQGHGLAIYSKSSFTFGPCIETRDVEATVFRVQQRPDVVIVFIYKSPKVSSKALPRSSTTDTDQIMTHKLHCRQAIKGPTTDYNTTIDLIFTNIQTYKCGIMEAYYTDHKPKFCSHFLIQPFGRILPRFAVLLLI